ncbi:MAG: amidohydrolase family protein, partial [Peptococcaceae bacterium]|nr:amidohydrolase family protein [Peptococcaceae bacterium]
MSSLRLTNGKIFTGNPTAPWAEELLILNGRIAWVGDGEAPSLPGVETLDLGGRLALPGLVDAHVHFLWYALGLDSVRMVGVESLDQALALVAERIRNSGPGEWIVGDSYNHNVWGMEREPNRYDLDRVAPDHPVFISSKCGHTAWVNSKALALAGVTAVTPNPEGSRIDRDSQGEPTGLLRESAQGLVGSVIPDPDPAKACMMLKRAIGIAHSMGLTGIHNCEGRDSLRHFGKLAREGELNFRVVHHVPADSLDEAITLGLTSGVGGE